MTELPPQAVSGTHGTTDRDLYALDAEFVLVKTTGVPHDTKEDLDNLCGALSGMSLVTVRNTDKLERVYEYIHTNYPTLSYVPIAYNAKGGPHYYGLVDGTTPVSQVVEAAAQSVDS